MRPAHGHRHSSLSPGDVGFLLTVHPPNTNKAIREVETLLTHYLERYFPVPPTADPVNAGPAPREPPQRGITSLSDESLFPSSDSVSSSAQPASSLASLLALELDHVRRPPLPRGARGASSSDAAGDGGSDLVCFADGAAAGGDDTSSAPESSTFDKKGRRGGGGGVHGRHPFVKLLQTNVKGYIFFAIRLPTAAVSPPGDGVACATSSAPTDHSADQVGAPSEQIGDVVPSTDHNNNTPTSGGGAGRAPPSIRRLEAAIVSCVAAAIMLDLNYRSNTDGRAAAPPSSVPPSPESADPRDEECAALAEMVRCMENECVTRGIATRDRSAGQHAGSGQLAASLKFTHYMYPVQISGYPTCSWLPAAALLAVTYVGSATTSSLTTSGTARCSEVASNTTVDPSSSSCVPLGTESSSLRPPPYARLCGKMTVRNNTTVEREMSTLLQAIGTAFPMSKYNWLGTDWRAHQHAAPRDTLVHVFIVHSVACVSVLPRFKIRGSYNVHCLAKGVATDVPSANATPEAAAAAGAKRSRVADMWLED